MSTIVPIKPQQSASGDPMPQWQADYLTMGGSLAQIVLDDQTYVLRITKSGKLILTK